MDTSTLATGFIQSLDRESKDAFINDVAKHMVCFFDLQLTTVLKIVKISSQSFQKARDISGMNRKWPFCLIKEGSYILKWSDIKSVRARMLVDASPRMKRILFQAEKTAQVMRCWHMPKKLLKEVQDMEFPDFPPDLDPAATNCKLENVEKEEDVGGLSEKVEIVAPINSSGMETESDQVQIMPPRRTHISRQQIGEIIHCLIDLPIKTVTGILKISHHTLLDIRKSVGLEEWPFDKIKSGSYMSSAVEVAIRRCELLKQMTPGTAQAKALTMARDMSETPNPAEPWAACVVECPAEEQDPGAMQSEGDQDDGLLGWFGILLQPGSGPAQNTVEEPERNEDEDRFWQDVHDNYSEDEKEYWNSIIDILHDREPSQRAH